MTVTVFLIRLLVLAVIFVNGWTDAPNAIATAVRLYKPIQLCRLQKE